MNVRERIKEIRSITGLSQAKFGNKYGIPKRSIENWESGKTECPSYLVDLLERVVKEDYEWKNLLINLNKRRNERTNE